MSQHEDSVWKEIGIGGFVVIALATLLAFGGYHCNREQHADDRTKQQIDADLRVRELEAVRPCPKVTNE